MKGAWIMLGMLLGLANLAHQPPDPRSFGALSEAPPADDQAVQKTEAEPKVFPSPEQDEPLASEPGRRQLVLAGGCFWCTEAVFEKLIGVLEVESGYAGGTAETARYDLVSRGNTDHAEAIRIVYDPSRITLGQLLKVFFSVAHDPTQLDRQGADVGRQYRSAIFFADPVQENISHAYIHQLNQARVFGRPIVTSIEPLNAFYPAESYHQNFVRRNPQQPYVRGVVLPKLEKLEEKYPGKLQQPNG